MTVNLVFFNQNFKYGGVSEESYLFSPEALQESSIFSVRSTESKMRIVAHRGDSDDAPENTIPALEQAVENGYTTAECDVSWTKDDVPVLLHDNTINRTARKSNGMRFFTNRKVASYTFDQLQNFDFGSWFSGRFKGTKIPSLQEALDYAKENNLELYLDLKNNVDVDDDKIATLVSMVRDSGMEDSVSWISFNAKTLQKIATAMPDARLGYLSKKPITDQTIETLNSLKNDTNDVFLDIKHTELDEKGIAKLNQAGFYYEAWTVDDNREAMELAKYGCRGITTNKLHGITLSN